MKMTIFVAAVCVAAMAAGCSMTTKCADFSGLSTPDGKATHVNTTNYAIHLPFSFPLVGDARLATTLKNCTAEAKALGASKIRVVQSDSTCYWFIFPPFSFVLQPVISNVAGDAIP